MLLDQLFLVYLQNYGIVPCRFFLCLPEICFMESYN